MNLFDNYKGDLAGAFSAAVITLPMSIGYGLIVFAPLGISFAPQAVMLGIYAAIITGFLASVFGGTPIQITAPKAPLALVLAYAVASFASAVPETVPSRELFVVALASSCVFIGGFFQILFGTLGLGNLIKYVPYHVMAGFMNGIAVILIMKQVKPLFGIDLSMHASQMADWMNAVQPFTLMVGLITLLTTCLSRQFIKRLPPAFTGLLIGTPVYYCIVFFFDDAAVGPVIGDISHHLPSYFLEWFNRSSLMDIRLFLPQIFMTGLTLGVVGSMETLLSSVVSDNLTGVRHDSNKELVGQGIGNTMGSFFGAIFSAGSIPRNMANYNAGGRTKLSGIMCSLIILMMIMMANPLISKIPMCVIAGIIIFTALELFDRETFHLMKQAAHNSLELHKDILINLTVSIIVTVVTICSNLIMAVAIGILLSSAMFIAKMGNSIIRRQYYGDMIKSRKMRSRIYSEIIDEHGSQIVILELHGPLFFGSADHLARTVETMMTNARYCIIDMKRVNDIDITGINILVQIKTMLEQKDKLLLISYLDNNDVLRRFIQHTSALRKLGYHCLFPDTDFALEMAEDHLLSDGIRFPNPKTTASLDQMSLLKDFSKKEMHALMEKLIQMELKKDEAIFLEGDKSRDLYILLKGSVSIKLRIQESNRSTRLITFSPGVTFGEIALIDGSPRSAGAWADQDSVVLKLSKEDFDGFRKHNPEIAFKLLKNISLEFSRNLRRLTNEVKALESH